MSDTPETDKEWRHPASFDGSERVVHISVSQKRERERDEAREERDHWKTEYEIVVARLCGKKHPRDNGIISEHEIIPKLTQERDEAREDRDMAQRYALDSDHAYDLMVKVVEKAESERDEAREALEYIAHSGLSARHIEDYAKEFLRRKGGK